MFATVIVRTVSSHSIAIKLDLLLLFQQQFLNCLSCNQATFIHILEPSLCLSHLYVVCNIDISDWISFHELRRFLLLCWSGNIFHCISLFVFELFHFISIINSLSLSTAQGPWKLSESGTKKLSPLPSTPHPLAFHPFLLYHAVLPSLRRRPLNT